MAGADRVEGTLFGHGERTGNVDLVTIALNLLSRGIDTGLDFSNIDEIVKVVESASRIAVHPRHPYAGDLVFTAFSGSHQDAIRKGMDSRAESEKIFDLGWKVPYLHLDPADIGREYEKLIRINSQSGKGGAVYVLENDYGIAPPKGMHPEIGRAIQQVADEKGDEISSEELLVTFKKEFVNLSEPYGLDSFRRVMTSKDGSVVRIRLAVSINGENLELEGEGNGPISAAVHALQGRDNVIDFILDDFVEQSLGHSADATAMAYISVIRQSDQRKFFGAGEHSNIDKAAMCAIFAALNRAAIH